MIKSILYIFILSLCVTSCSVLHENSASDQTECDQLKQLLKTKISRVNRDTFTFNFTHEISPILVIEETERQKEFQKFSSALLNYEHSDCRLTYLDIRSSLGECSIINNPGQDGRGEIWIYTLDFGKNCGNYRNEGEVICGHLVFIFNTDGTLRNASNFPVYWDIEPNIWD